MMQQRPVRPHIYLPIVKWGVVHTDWKYVYLFAALCYVVPFIFGWQLRGFPLALPLGVAGLAVAIIFFNYTRQGRPPGWLQHTSQTLWNEFSFWQKRRGPHLRRTTHAEERRRAALPWLILEEEERT